MMRVTVLAGLAMLALLSGCQTTKNQTTEASAAFAKFPQGCYLRPALDGQVAYQSADEAFKSEQGVTGGFISKESLSEKMTTGCICRNSFDMTKLMGSEARIFLENIGKSNGYKSAVTEYIDHGNRKTARFEAVSDNFLGKFVGKGLVNFEGNCMQFVTGWVEPGRVSALDAYLASAYGARQVQSPAGAAGNVEARLAAIRDLRDRNVITQQEYDDRRRAILGSL